MARWKYSIEISYIANNTTIVIPPENIRRIIIDHDYDNKYTPTIYCDLTIDKNLFDDIILNASTAYMILRIVKSSIPITSIGNPSSAIEELIYNAPCEYFVDHDINYNKDIDYEPTGSGVKRKDVWISATIGLMFKDPINWNKKTTNMTVLNTTMMNIVASVISGIPTLIEPFTYNPNIDQLIIPPDDSLTKTISFLNDVKVFYDTPYRLFFEPEALYMVSSSGKPTQMKTEKYDTVKFILYKPSDMEGHEMGMVEDDEHKCYQIRVSTVDTVYNIDHTTGKDFNQIKSILDPAINNTKSTAAAVSTLIDKFKSIKDSLQSTIQNASSILKNIPSQLSGLKVDVNEILDITNNNTNVLMEIIDDCKSKVQSANDSKIASNRRAEIISDLDNIKANINGDNTTVGQLSGCLSDGQSQINSLLGNITNCSGCLGGISSINNAMSGIKSLNSSFSIINFGNNKVLNSVQTVNAKLNNMKNLKTYCMQLKISVAQCSPVLTAATLQDYLSTLDTCANEYDKQFSDMGTKLGEYSKIANSFKNPIQDIESEAKKLQSIQTDIKAAYTNTLTNLQTLGETYKKTLSSIAENAKQMAQDLSASGLSMDKLTDISKNLNSVKDLSSLGKLGISSFDAKLNLDKNKDEATGDKIIKIDNDNANKVKNIKAEIENSKNILTLNKADLDMSVFTINKKYIIKNFDAHSDKDGIFILINRKDILTREDDRMFICNEVLMFKKVGDEQSAATDSANITTSGSSESAATKAIERNTIPIVSNTTSYSGMGKGTISDIKSMAKILTSDK